MKRVAALVPMLLFSLVLPASADRYEGKVGKLEAIFNIHWGGDDKVAGSYRHPSREGVVYRLEGAFAENGSLILNEYTDGKHTATLFLEESGGQDKVRWSGTMKNADGRELEVWFGE